MDMALGMRVISSPAFFKQNRYANICNQLLSIRGDPLLVHTGMLFP